MGASIESSPCASSCNTATAVKALVLLPIWYRSVGLADGPSPYHVRPAATLTAEAGIAVFKVTFERWTGDTEQDFAYFVREADAALSVKGKDAWGSDGSEGVAQATRRQAALDKLSDDDKKALGLRI